MSITAEPTVMDLINEVLETIENPEPTAVARAAWDRLTPDQQFDFGIQGFANRVRAETSRRRHGKGGAATVSARWQEVAEDADSGALDYARLIARVQIFNGDVHRWLPDCTYDDLVGAAGEQESQAQALLVGAQKLTNVADMVKRKRKAATVADLDPQKVWEALNA